jgi:hypothetical protein
MNEPLVMVTMTRCTYIPVPPDYLEDPDVRLTSGLTRTVFFILFHGGSPFFGGKKMKKKTQKTGPLGVRGGTVYAY